MRTKLARDALEEMKASPIWTAGAQLEDFEGGLRPEKMLDMTDVEIQSAVDKIFKYDDQPKANPDNSTTMSPFVPCRIRNFGLCDTDEWLVSVRVIAKIFTSFLLLLVYGPKRPSNRHVYDCLLRLLPSQRSSSTIC